MRQVNKTMIVASTAAAVMGSVIYGVYRARNSSILERIKNRLT
ncbi:MULTISPECIES: hypothetical protein [unclassified Paenibacillus]|nr:MULTISPECIES: hypothetical protein [unclassified Paenibacillus]